MRTYLDCYPCFLRQALEATRMAGGDEREQRAVLMGVLDVLRDAALSCTPPDISRRVHDIVRQETGVEDPYRAAKERSAQEALALYPWLVSIVADADDPLETAVRLSIAGNIIDMGAGMDQVADVIDNGSNAPGTDLKTCSDDFRRLFGQAELIIAKGQANYETLSEEGPQVFFLLQTKCPIIAQHIGVPLGSLIVHRGQNGGSRSSRGEDELL